MPAIWRRINRFEIAGNMSVVAIALAGVALFAPVAAADNGENGPPVFMMSWSASNDTIPDDPPFTYNPAQFGSVQYGTWQLGGDASGQGGPLRQRTGWRYQGGLTNLAWTLSWDCVANADPFVDATINVQNTTGTDQVFGVFMPLMINPSILTNTMMSGFVSTVVTDADFSGLATLSATNSDPVYQGFIDGNALPNARMWNPGYALNAFNLTANDNDSFSNNLGPPAGTSIGIMLRFVLSPFDSASITGTFDVQPVPGPAGLPLLTLAGLMVGRRRRA